MGGIISKLGERAQRLSHRFSADRHGAIAPMAAFTLIPLLIGAGVALDVSRLISSSNTLQDAVDSANLAVARLPATATVPQMRAVATAWLNANVTDANIINMNVGAITRSYGQVQLDVSADVTMTLSGIVGPATLPIKGHSTVKYGTSHIELALVLDNTGSMAQNGKIDALKAAATTLVNTLQASATLSGDANALKVSVVPFSMSVNIGTANQGQSWLVGSMPSEYGATGDALGSGHPNRFTLFSQLRNQSWGGCVESRPMPYDITDTPPAAGTPATLFVPYFAPDEPDDGYYQWNSSIVYAHGAYGGRYYDFFNDYMNDSLSPPDQSGNYRIGGNWQNHQENATKYTGSLARTGTSAVWGDAIGPNSGCIPTTVQRLTTNTTAVLAKLATMTPQGDTEIPLGLMWGWHTLSPSAPFADGTPYQTNGTHKIIVLVTDGMNTYGSFPNFNGSFYTAYGYAASKRIDPGGTAAGTAAALNTRLAALCSNLKVKNPDGTDKVTIYTVPLEVTDPTIKSLLQGCATQPDYYLDVASSADLAAAFTNIAGSISGLRVAH